VIRLIDILLEQLSPAELAHKMGWTSAGWGYWKDASGNTIAKTEGDRLVPVSDKPDTQPSPTKQTPNPSASLEDFRTSIVSKYNPKDFDIKRNPTTGDIQLASIIIGKDSQGTGIGTKIMDDLIKYADSQGSRITLTPAQKDKGHGTTSSARLQKFYKRFGFTPNSGRNKDFRVRDSMIRNPVVKEGIKVGVGDGAAAGRSRDTWRVDSEDSSVVRYGARNSVGQVRYFKSEEAARKFASGETKGPHPGRPKPKQRANPVQRKQTYRFRND
jgi:GNAT superfamily N-acetyltransferase